MVPTFHNNVQDGQIRLSSVQIQEVEQQSPPCVPCLFGQAHRKQWHFKKTKDVSSNKSLRGEQISSAGDTVSIDQLISAQPGLVPQEKGIMTRAHIWAATIFIGHVTGYIHV